jgi:beta-lactamase regulating signal transducer with metallopeptidase domain
MAAEVNAVHEHLTHAIYYTEIHLMFCSIVWLAAWALTSIPGASASTKHWIWLATALNFIVPLGAIFDGLLAQHISWASPIGLVGGLGAYISETTPIALSLAALWLLGFAAMLARLWTRIVNERRLDRASVDTRNSLPDHTFTAGGIAVSIVNTRRGPAVTGILRAQISLPAGIDRLLSEQELNSVLMHELTHARRRDNLIRLTYELALCALWFHPLVWITGSRLALYRELSCDENVIRSGLGRELLSALGKLANVEEEPLLQATATSLISHRLARLTAESSSRMSLRVNALLSIGFAAILGAGVFATVAHTACCFIAKS